MHKICFVTEDFYPDFIGGQGVYGYHLVSQMANLGCFVTVLAEKRASRKEFWSNKKNISLMLVPFCFGNQLLLAVFEYFIFIFRLRNTYFDIVHANQLSGLFFVLFKPHNVGKVILSVHNTNYDMAHEEKSIRKRLLYQPLILLEKVMYQKADGLLFNSPDEEKVVRKYLGITKIPTKSVYLGIPLPKIRKQEEEQAHIRVRKRHAIGLEQKIVLYIGRLVKRKKIDTLLKALTILSQSNSNVTGIVIGKGRERRQLEKIAPPNVVILGFVSDTREYLLAADLFVTISVAEGGFSLAVLEAASYGLPLIVSPSVAGFPILQEGKNGSIVDPRDPVALAKKIKEALKKSQSFGKESKSIARRFNLGQSAKETHLFYQRVLLKTISREDNPLSQETLNESAKMYKGHLLGYKRLALDED